MDNVSGALTSLYRRCGYERFRMSKFEEYGLYSEHRAFLPSAGMITFTDTDGRLMALKPDVTLSIVRGSRDGVRSKYCYNESVFRTVNGRFTEVEQAGLEYIGDPDPVCLSEVLLLAYLSLRRISDTCVLDVSDLRILTAAAKRADVSDFGLFVKRIGQKNLSGALQLCRNGCAEKLVGGLLSAPSEPAEAEKLLFSLSDGEEWDGIVGSFFRVVRAVDGCRFDISVVNDPDYYSGLVMQGYIEGVPAAVLSGGEYGNLMKKMGKNNSAAGFAVYLDRLGGKSEPAFAPDRTVFYGKDDDPSAVIGSIRRALEEGGSVMSVPVKEAD